MCDDTVKLCAIADGMCVGQCEGLTFYKVAVDGSVQIVRVIIHNRPRPECVRVVVGLYSVSPHQTKHSFRSARVLPLVDADGYSPGLGPSIPMQSTMLVVDAVSTLCTDSGRHCAALFLWIVLFRYTIHYTWGLYCIRGRNPDTAHSSSTDTYPPFSSYHLAIVDERSNEY